MTAPRDRSPPPHHRFRRPVAPVGARRARGAGRAARHQRHRSRHRRRAGRGARRGATRTASGLSTASRSRPSTPAATSTCSAISSIPTTRTLDRLSRGPARRPRSSACVRSPVRLQALGCAIDVEALLAASRPPAAAASAGRSWPTRSSRPATPSIGVTRSIACSATEQPGVRAAVRPGRRGGRRSRSPAAGGIASLAHPGLTRRRRPDSGVRGERPRRRSRCGTAITPRRRSALPRARRTLGLAVSGGSDFHGEHEARAMVRCSGPGAVTLGAEDFAALEARRRPLGRRRVMAAESEPVTRDARPADLRHSQKRYQSLRPAAPAGADDRAGRARGGQRLRRRRGRGARQPGDRREPARRGRGPRARTAAPPTSQTATSGSPRSIASASSARAACCSKARRSSRTWRCPSRCRSIRCRRTSRRRSSRSRAQCGIDG